MPRLNPKYTFDRLRYRSVEALRARGQALAVAESPAKAYNPLFVYGGSGLGKTHLLHADRPLRARVFPRPSRFATSRRKNYTQPATVDAAGA